MRSDDLTGLLQPTPDPSAFRQGQIVTFDPATGANTVNVAGALLTDLPLLNIGDTVNLLPDDVVVLIKYGASWAILGRVVTPGSASLSANVVATQTQSAGALGPANLSGTNLIIAQTGNFTIPSWANRIDFMAVGFAHALNSTANAEELYCSVAVDYSDAVQQASGDIRQGIGSNAVAGAQATLDQMSTGQTYADFRTGAIGGLTFVANIRLRTNGSAIAAGGVAARVSCIAVYTKV
jgi:hypothetical protein